MKQTCVLLKVYSKEIALILSNADKRFLKHDTTKINHKWDMLVKKQSPAIMPDRLRLMFEVDLSSNRSTSLWRNALRDGLKFSKKIHFFRQFSDSDVKRL